MWHEEIRTTWRSASGLLGIGLAGALVADLVGAPMPYLVGALAAVGLFVALRAARGQAELHFPTPVRKLFVALIGVMIGASFSVDLMGSLVRIWPSLLVMVVFVLVALGFGTILFQRFAGYDRVTAFYAAMPGGLIEAVALGEAAGGNVRALTLQHFARIVLVVVTVPLLYLIWSGNAVGSAGGQSFETGLWGALDVVEIVGLALAGIWLGPKLRVPAAHLVGPLLVSAALHGTGLLQISSPAWLLAMAQLVVGTGLGTSFSGAKPADLGRAIGFATIYVGVVLTIAWLVAYGLAAFMPFSFDTLFVSFAPGGVTEMGLVALSLGISPVVVTAHHVFRIVLTVVIAGATAKWIRSTAERARP